MVVATVRAVIDLALAGESSFDLNLVGRRWLR